MGKYICCIIASLLPIILLACVIPYKIEQLRTIDLCKELGNQSTNGIISARSLLYYGEVQFSDCYVGTFRKYRIEYSNFNANSIITYIEYSPKGHIIEYNTTEIY